MSKKKWHNAWKLDRPLVAAENFAEAEKIRQVLLPLSFPERVLKLYHILSEARGNDEKLTTIKKVIYSGKWTSELSEAAKYFGAGVQPAIRGKTPQEMIIINAAKEEARLIKSLEKLKEINNAN